MSTAPKKTRVDEPETASEAGPPEGWFSAFFPDVCRLNPGKPAADALPPAAPVTFVPMPAVDAELGAITKPETRPFSKVRKGYTAFAENDLIMAKITPCMENGKAAVARGLQNGFAFGSTEFHVFRSYGAVIPDYLYYFIRQESYRKSAENEMTGSVGQKRVPVDFLERSQIPVPPFAEQTRILEKLNALIARTRSTRTRLEKIPSILKYFRQSVLAAACSGKLTGDWRKCHTNLEPASVLLREVKKNHDVAGVGHGGKAATPTEDIHTLSADDLPDVWALEELKWLCQPGRSITYGILKPGHNQPNGVPYIRVADFPRGRLEVTGVKKTTRKIADGYARSALRPGDVLLSIRGTVGRVCRVPDELDGANITQDTARIAVHPDISADYVEIYLRSPSIQKRLEAAMKGVAVRGVNIGDVRVLQVAVPPIQEQLEIVRRVDALFKLADAIEKRVAAASLRAERLTQATLAKAFRGELVPTEAELARREGREYEPASVLLERVKEQRAVAQQKARRSSGRKVSKRGISKSIS